MTGYGTVDSAIEAMRAGAFHYLAKPFKAEEVLNLVDKAYAQRQLKRENLRDHMTDLELIFSMLGEAATTEIARRRTRSAAHGFQPCD